jgi:hypothetical protein
MARRLDTFDVSRADRVGGELRRRSDRSTARALAAAISALAIATVVVSQSTSALDPEGTVSAGRFDSGTIELLDDDRGRSLVDVTNMAPGRPVEACITVTYAGTILPVDVSLSAETTGDVGTYLDARVERGRAAGFDSCDGFVSDGTIFDGSVGVLAEGSGVDAGVLRSDGESIAFRFTFDLVDEADAAGRAGSLDLVWQAVPG